MPVADNPEPVKPDIVRNLGRTLCAGVLVPWLMSGFMHFRPAFFFGCLAAFVLPRFIFRRLRSPVFIHWSRPDWLWTLLALVITLAYFAVITPPRLASWLGI